MKPAGVEAGNHGHPPVPHGGSWKRRWQWIGVGLLAAAALVLGYAGFDAYFKSTGQTRTPLDLVYLTLQLFVLESGSAAYGEVPAALQAARLMAPVVPVWAAVLALAAVFRERVRAFCLRFARGHTVVCGLGRRGFEIVSDYRDAGERVVAIERDGENPNIGVCRQMGATVLVGDATDPFVLRQACVQRAGRVIAVCTEDGTNVEVGVRVHRIIHDLPETPSPPLDCLVHLVDRRLYRLFSNHDMFGRKHDGVRFRTFNFYEDAADGLWQRRELFREHKLARLVIIGLGQMGTSVLLRGTEEVDKEPERRLRVSIVDTRGENKDSRFRERYPREAEKLEDLTVHTGQADDPESLRMIRNWAAEESEDTTVAICFDDDARTLAQAMMLSAEIHNPQVAVVARMSEEGGLETLLRETDHRPDSLKSVDVFGMMGETCCRDRLPTGE